MKTRIINLILLMVAFAMTALALSLLPDIVGVHFDIHGNPDRFGSKYELLILPLTVLVMQVVFEIVFAYLKRSLDKTDDEKVRAEATSNLKQIGIVSVVTSVVLIFVNAFTLYASYSSVSVSSPSVDIMKCIGIIIGLALVIMGDRMPKTRINSIVGFRLPWTMYNDVTWRKSNLFASRVMMLTGIILAVCALIFDGIVISIIIISLLIVSILISTYYAYTVYKKEKNNEN